MLTECRESAAERRKKSTRLENLGIPEEELLRQQQELFARARESALLQERQQQTVGVDDNGNVGNGGGDHGVTTQDHDQDTGSDESES